VLASGVHTLNRYVVHDAQGPHTVSEVELQGVVWYVPDLHIEQVWHEVDADVLENELAAHAVQLDAPACDAKVPASHRVQLVMLALTE